MSSTLKKTLGFVDRLRSKSFDKAIISGNNLASYHYIENFDNVTEEECIKIDTQNRETYKKNMDLYENISKQIEHKNAMFKIDIPPTPPNEPSNYDKFISHRMRNISRNVRYQTYAVHHLLLKGYRLIFESKQNRSEIEFEPFEAIDLFEKLEGVTVEVAIRKEFTILSISQPTSPINMRKSLIPPYNSPPYHTENYYYHNMQTSAQPVLVYPSVPNLPNLPNQYIPSEKSEKSELSSSPKHYISAPPASHFIHHN
jgi:hypothetical protein